MASSGRIIGTTSNQYISSKIEWSATPNNANNTSAVTATLYYKRNNDYAGGTSGKGVFIITIGGETKTVATAITIGSSSWVSAMSFTSTVKHNEDGTCSVKITGEGSIPSTTLSATYCGKTVTLDTISTASTITAAYDVILGNSCKIVWTPRSTAFYFKVKFELGNFTHTTEAFCPGTTSAYTYTGYQIPLDAATWITPNVTSGTMFATLYTYSDNGVTQVGTASTKTFYVEIPEIEATIPTVRMTLSPVTPAPYDKFSSLYLRGISKVKATFEGEGKYGATIQAYSLQVEGGRYLFDSDYTSNILTQSGESTIVGFVSDSRWFGNHTIQTINVIAYELPYISPSSANNKVICERCKEDGTPYDSGTYLHIKGKRNYTKIDENGIVNTCSVSCAYKAEDGTWSQAIDILPSSNTATDDFDVIIPNAVTDVTKSYTVELGIMDKTNIYQRMTFNVPSEVVTFHLREGGGGAAFGQYATEKDLLECAWGAKFHKDIYINGVNVSDFVVEQGTTGIWYYRKWFSGKAECWAQKRLNVAITTAWGAGIYYGTIAGVSFPSNLFTEAPHCHITAEFGGNQQLAWLCAGGSTTKDETPDLWFCRPDSTANAASFDVSFYAIGNWK